MVFLIWRDLILVAPKLSSLFSAVVAVLALVTAVEHHSLHFELAAAVVVAVYSSSETPHILACISIAYGANAMAAAVISSTTQ